MAGMNCSFCGRRDSEVAKLVAGPRRMLRKVYICDRCAAQTVAIMDASFRRDGTHWPASDATSTVDITFEI